MSYTALLKVPLLLLAAKGVQIAVTSPNPPPALEEQNKYGSDDDVKRRDFLSRYYTPTASTTTAVRNYSYYLLHVVNVLIPSSKLDRKFSHRAQRVVHHIGLILSLCTNPIHPQLPPSVIRQVTHP